MRSRGEHVGVRYLEVPFRRFVEAPDQVQERCLAAPRWPHKGDEGGRLDLESDPIQGPHANLACCVILADIFRYD